jgi:hypothetical protein
MKHAAEVETGGGASGWLGRNTVSAFSEYFMWLEGKEFVLLLLSSSLWPDCCVEACICYVEEVLGRIYNAHILSSVSVCIVRQARATDE